MAGKCEHGLTTAECFVCASPKYGLYPHHCEPGDVAALVRRLEALADPAQEPIPSYADTDWRTLAGVAARVIKYLRSPTRSEARAAAGFTRRPSLKAIEMRAALELIATPQRPDGTWNRDREACRELAAEALGRYDDSKTPNVGVEPPERSARTQS